MKKITKKEFLKRAKEKFGDRFDYSQIEYKTLSKEKIKKTDQISESTAESTIP